MSSPVPEFCSDWTVAGRMNGVPVITEQAVFKQACVLCFVMTKAFDTGSLIEETQRFFGSGVEA